jgi:hypothetical protein
MAATHHKRVENLRGTSRDSVGTQLCFRPGVIPLELEAALRFRQRDEDIEFL